MTEKLLPISSAKSSWLRLGKYAARRKQLIAVMFLFFVISSLASVVIPNIIGAMINGVINGTFTDFPWQLCAAIGAALLVQVCAAMFWDYQAEKVGAGLHKDLGVDAMDAALSLNAQTLEDAGSGDLVTRVTNDLTAVHRSITVNLPYCLYTMSYLVVVLLFVALLHPALIISVLPIVVGVPVLVWVVLPKTAARIADSMKLMSKLSTTVNENVRGLVTARELGVLAQREAVLVAQNAEYMGLERRVGTMRSIMYGSNIFISSLPILLVLMWGTVAVPAGWSSWGAVSTIALIMFNVSWQVEGMLWSLDALRETSVTLRRVCGVIDLAQQQQQERAVRLQTDGANANSASSISGTHSTAAGDNSSADGADTHTISTSGLTDKIPAIELRGVTYGYAAERPVLHDINLRVAAGSTLALVGRSGSGKTTLARLMAGSLTADNGAVYVLGQQVGNGLFPTNPAADGRPRLLICTQEAHQFVGSVRDNLTIVRPHASEADMLAALAAVRADWVAALPEGIDTLLGAEGAQLSRDQVQQLSLARIVLADPHVVILDESTTQLELVDAHESVRAIMRGRTVVIISHDTRIAGLADTAVLLADGVIAASGTPDEIFARA